MCGIAGFTRFDGGVSEPKHVVELMVDAVSHRGPDDRGTFIDSRIALGHARLSIIDIQGGRQPMSFGPYKIIFNGEIYNYIELRRDLEAQGRRFSTNSDTEVILQQFAAEGIDGFNKLNGMFAFALWDSDKAELILSRDRMGEKPLFYAIRGSDIIFASELKALLKYPGINRSGNLNSVSKYLTFGYVPAPHTIYKYIHKLEAGQYLVFNSSGMKRRMYWDIPLQDEPISTLTMQESEEQILALLQASVRQRLRSDVPVGIFLSGGIDSSAITAMAAKESPATLSTFSIGFEESTYDESPHAKKIADLFQTDHHHEILSMRRASEILFEVPTMMDEPFADASIIPTYLLARLARGHVKVVLGGDGSDELFIGYPSFVAHKVTEALSFLHITWRDRLNRLARKIPVSSNYASVDFLLQQYFKGVGISADARFLIWMGFCGNVERNTLLSRASRDALLYEDPFEDVIGYAKRNDLDDAFQRINYLSMKMYLQDGILVKVDRASMANSLEVRSPFLDHKMVEFACRIHPKYKLNRLTTKYILKKALIGILPNMIIHRRKSGFMMPVADWLRTEMKPVLEDVCSESQIRSDGIFDPAAVRKFIDEHTTRTRDHRKILWALLCFQLWKRACAPGVEFNG